MLIPTCVKLIGSIVAPTTVTATASAVRHLSDLHLAGCSHLPLARQGQKTLKRSRWWQQMLTLPTLIRSKDCMIDISAVSGQVAMPTVRPYAALRSHLKLPMAPRAVRTDTLGAMVATAHQRASARTSERSRCLRQAGAGHRTRRRIDRFPVAHFPRSLPARIPAPRSRRLSGRKRSVRFPTGIGVSASPRSMNRARKRRGARCATWGGQACVRRFPIAAAVRSDRHYPDRGVRTRAGSSAASSPAARRRRRGA